MKTLICTLFLLFHVPAECTQIIVPNNLASAEGNSAAWPFTVQDIGITSRRYQQVYDASQFISRAPLGGYITELWFRENGGQITQDAFDSVQINFSVTIRTPDGLSASFSENVGAFEATVYGPSPLEINTAIGWTIIPLAQPFLYLPADGNLLLDIRTIDNFSPFPFPITRNLDAENTSGDSISAVMANDINATSGFITSSGLITLFEIQPIPEPSTWALLGLGLFGIWRFRVRQNNQRNKKCKG